MNLKLIPQIEVTYAQSRVPHLIPEQKLLFAMLECAVRDALQTQIARPRDKTEALAWIFAPTKKYGDLLWEFSYAWVCDELDLDPSILRNVILDEIKRAKLKQAMTCIRKTRSGYARKKGGV